ncbi:hypothetical protein [uncultured Desulfobacter sp.]|uniref:hypothetical protein n=1 Tax=uncultured Desulfobacter sp. TaxID=240139 RepID=UPI0029F4D855|nr:hypothetical protein [uncultured Desulfobacter sp.]
MPLLDNYLYYIFAFCFLKSKYYQEAKINVIIIKPVDNIDDTIILLFKDINLANIKQFMNTGNANDKSASHSYTVCEFVLKLPTLNIVQGRPNRKEKTEKTMFFELSKYLFTVNIFIKFTAINAKNNGIIVMIPFLMNKNILN